jgi:carbon-monoxide dehydrogenase small subunit
MRSWLRAPDVSKRSIALRLNDIDRTVEIEDQTMLLEMVRTLGYVGAKLSCDMEVCGACTVLLDGRPVSSCTTLAVEADGRTVETVESLADGVKLHPLQEAFIDKFAFQCGYCTPGMIMSAKALLDASPRPTAADVRHWMEGNICRCTGYSTIVEAVLDASRRIGERP